MVFLKSAALLIPIVRAGPSEDLIRLLRDLGAAPATRLSFGRAYPG